MPFKFLLIWVVLKLLILWVQVAESEAVLVSFDQVEASGSTFVNNTLEDKINQQDADPSNDKV
jgi:hypothetical protein